MLKFFILFAIATVFFLQIIPAYCQSGRTLTLLVSATLPEHVMMTNALEPNAFSNNPLQLVQTQTVIRNNKSIRLVSIVVP